VHWRYWLIIVAAIVTIVIVIVIAAVAAAFAAAATLAFFVLHVPGIEALRMQLETTFAANKLRNEGILVSKQAMHASEKLRVVATLEEHLTRDGLEENACERPHIDSSAVMKLLEHFRRTIRS
jgi:hypothetical protein